MPIKSSPIRFTPYAMGAVSLLCPAAAKAQQVQAQPVVYGGFRYLTWPGKAGEPARSMPPIQSVAPPPLPSVERCAASAVATAAPLAAMLPPPAPPLYDPPSPAPVVYAVAPPAAPPRMTYPVYPALRAPSPSGGGYIAPRATPRDDVRYAMTAPPVKTPPVADEAPPIQVAVLPPPTAPVEPPPQRAPQPERVYAQTAPVAPAIAVRETSASSAPNALQVGAGSPTPGGVRYYSLHSEYGLTPDRDPAPSSADTSNAPGTEISLAADSLPTSRAGQGDAPATPPPSDAAVSSSAAQADQARGRGTGAH